MNKIKVYAPLFLVEVYLLLGLWLLFYGPIIWPLQNTSEFLGFIFLYHIFFIGGYIVQSFYFAKKSKVNKTPLKIQTKKNKFTHYFWLILVLALAANIVQHRNLTLSHSYIPNDFFSNLHRGLVAPWQARAFYASDAAMDGFINNPLITASLFFTSAFKYILLPGLVFYWHTLSTFRKIAGVLIATIPLLSGIIASLSAINFSYFFIISICLGILVVSNKSSGVFSTIKQRKFFTISLVAIFFFSFWQFYSVKSGHSPYQVAFENSVPERFEYLKDKGIRFKSDETNTERTHATDLYEKLTIYMVQGYYGMSIALDEDFTTSFGIGHSVFLQKAFAEYLGFDIRDRTFQHKISEQWDEFVYWHSFYSYIANDVGFFGVAIIMLILGAYFSWIYLSAIMYEDFFARMLLPLFGILFLYIPANNQVFGFLETMTSFWVLTVLFIFSRPRVSL
ncbi:hypothetical protein ACI51W_04040 [Pseudomonas marginalis]|uniref:hypothetical protein n=1 Tax=Pseudomonas marginalis TaxID=298 RepID=UPI0034D62DAA